MDRGLCSVYWLDVFPNAKITHLLAAHSNNTPIFLSMDSARDTHKVYKFKFQVAWVEHEEFLQVVENGWKKDHMFQDSVNSTAEALNVWNKSTFGNIYRKKETVRSQT